MPAVQRVEGLNETIAYLKLFDVENYKAINKELYGEMKRLVGVGRSMAPTTSPMSGWEAGSEGSGRWGSVLAFSPGKVRTGIRTKIGPVRRKDTNTRERTYFLLNANPAGAVYETAGRKSRGKTPQGRQFVTNIENYSGEVVIGKQGRLAWKAVYQNRKEVTYALAQVVRKYEEIINRKLAK